MADHAGTGVQAHRRRGHCTVDALALQEATVQATPPPQQLCATLLANDEATCAPAVGSERDRAGNAAWSETVAAREVAEDARGNIRGQPRPVRGP